jgi:GntR family transcriptional repressor for pyruvate dehydrogenase complex
MDTPHRDRYRLLSTEVAERLQAFVLDGGYQPGDRLPSERELALKFDVSRTAIREGIKLLTQTGLLESSIGRGLYVGRLNTDPVLASLTVLLRVGGGTALDVVLVRNALEALAARLAAIHATEDELAELAGLLAELERMHQAGEGYGQTGPAFHVAMARASHNPLIVALLEPTLVLMYRVEQDTFVATPGTLRGLENHRRIYHAIANRDPDEAAAAIEDHCHYLMELRHQRMPDWEEIRVGTTSTAR